MGLPATQYRKVVGFLEQNDFKSADVKKLAPTSSLMPAFAETRIVAAYRRQD